MKELFQEYEGSECKFFILPSPNPFILLDRFEDVLTELKFEYERKFKEYEQLEYHERSDAAQALILRSRQEVRKKLYELGLVENARDFGKIKRNRTSKKPAPEFEELEGGIFKAKTIKGRKSGRGKRRRDSDDEELVYVMSDSEVRLKVLKLRNCLHKIFT